MKTLWSSVATLAAGAAAMYYLDPKMGGRRRAQLRDKMKSAQRKAARYAGKQAKRVGDEMRGSLAQTRAHADGDAARTDTKLVQRVRSQLGRLTSSPGAIDVTAHAGCVALQGHVLAAEHVPLVQMVRAVDGVHELDDQLIVHDRPGNTPELQGAARSPA